MGPIQTTYEWRSSFKSLPYSMDVLRNSLTLIAGPSGVGKTAIASTLVNVDLVFKILRNHTTRSPRSTDQLGHFEYLSDQAFLDAYREGLFFLSRFEPHPRYAYRTDQVVKLISTGMRPILMFRHGGIKFITDSIGGVPTVFVEGKPREIVRHSRNIESSPTEETVEETLYANRRMQDLMMRNHWPWLRVTNHFSGEAELHTIATQIREFRCKLRL